MATQEYNGWANYETWRVNLEIFSDREWSDDDPFTDLRALAEYLAEEADEAITNYGELKEGLALDYARSFLSDVNWEEIAEHIAEDYPGIIASDDDEEEVG